MRPTDAPESLESPIGDVIRIGNRAIGKGAPTYIIAEIGINHQGSLDMAIELVERAARAGADAVKFQKRDLASLYQKDMLDNLHRYERPYQYLLPILKKSELSLNDYYRLRDKCHELGVEFLCTPFDLPSADFLEALDVPAYKVASSDLTNSILIEHLASKQRPLILSTGASLMPEIEKTVAFLRFHRVNFALLHCNASYPTLMADVNLKFLDQLKKFGVPVGYSGHEMGIVIPLAAVAMGAKIVEKHITLDKNLEGPDHRISLLPEELAEMVRGIRTVEEAQGDGQKTITQGETMNREVLGKSLVAARTIRQGDVLTREMITVKSPGKGLSPQYLGRLLGQPASRDMNPDDVFTEDDLHRRSDAAIELHPHGKWGLVVRPSDADHAAQLAPRVMEFHLTSMDLTKRIPKLSMDAELIVHAPEYIEQELLDLCDPVESRRRHSVQFIRRVMTRTCRLAEGFQGTPKVVVHPGGMSFSPLDATEVRRRQSQFRRSMQELLDDAGKLGLLLLPENLPPYPWYFGGQWRSYVFTDADEMRSLAEEFSCGLCFDLSHAQLTCTAAGKRLADFARTVRPFVRHMHVSDAKGVNGEGVQIGEGDIPFEEVLEPYADYTDSWVPEIWRGHLNGGRTFLVAINAISAHFRRAKYSDDELIREKIAV